jgi:HAD superfamily hydrolase (TIGR01509 family)
MPSAISATSVLRVIKAVFFDWFYTLARFEPSREILYEQAFREFGVSIPRGKIMRGILIGDQHFFVENARTPVAGRSPQEQLEVFIRYPEAIIAEAGAAASREVCAAVIQRVRDRFEGATFALFDDVLPTLQMLKKRCLTVGLLTNIDREMGVVCQKLGIEPYLDFVITSKQAGADKPKPPIFRAALAKAGIAAAEAVHVGDQYKIDVVGARGVGINPVLIDRYDIFPDITDCPRIQRLSELALYL